VAFRKTLYESLEQLQEDLDRYLEFYNRERAHQGYRTQGRTLYRAFRDGVNHMSRSEGAIQPAKELAEKVNQLPKGVVA